MTSNEILRFIYCIASYYITYELNCKHVNFLRNTLHVFLSGEGPRSRDYGRTAAMRLIMQPCDDDEDDEDDYFLSFS
jgi:hypothetical protein